MTRTIFRIETPNLGQGMYARSPNAELESTFGRILACATDGELTDCGNEIHLMPNDDKALGWSNLEWEDKSHLWFFGFSTVAQLLTWTISSKIRKMMSEVGFVVVEYQVNDSEHMREGQAQAIFLRHFACRKDTHDLVDLCS